VKPMTNLQKIDINYGGKHYTFLATLIAGTASIMIGTEVDTCGCFRYEKVPSNAEEDRQKPRVLVAGAFFCTCSVYCKLFVVADPSRFACHDCQRALQHVYISETKPSRNSFFSC